MEKGKGYRRFFFEDATSRLSSLFRWISNEYEPVHNRPAKRDDPRVKESFVSIIRKIQKQRADFNIKIGNKQIGGVGYEQLIKMTIFDYFQFIDRATNIIKNESKQGR